MEKVHVAVVGVGWVAQVVHLPILKRLPEVEVVALCDSDKRRVMLVAEKFGIKHAYDDLSAMLAMDSIEAVIVCTSTETHKEVTLAALAAGKDVLVEKPIALRHADAAAMVEAAKQHKRKLMVGMNHRFRPDTMLMKSFIEGKELGKISYAKSGWLQKMDNHNPWLVNKSKAGGGVFLDLGLVMFDVAFWMLGYPEVKRVSATNFHHRTKDIEDTSLVHLVMKNGSALDIEVGWSTLLEDDSYYCNIYGNAGSATLSPLRIYKELHGSLVNLAPTKIEPPHQLFKRSYENELKHFFGAVHDHHPIISTGDEAVQRMRVVEAVYKSAKTGKEVVFSKG